MKAVCWITLTFTHRLCSVAEHFRGSTGAGSKQGWRTSGDTPIAICQPDQRLQGAAERTYFVWLVVAAMHWSTVQQGKSQTETRRDASACHPAQWRADA